MEKEVDVLTLLQSVINTKFNKDGAVLTKNLHLLKTFV